MVHNRAESPLFTAFRDPQSVLSENGGFSPQSSPPSEKDSSTHNAAMETFSSLQRLSSDSALSSCEPERSSIRFDSPFMVSAGQVPFIDDFHLEGNCEMEKPTSSSSSSTQEGSASLMPDKLQEHREKSRICMARKRKRDKEILQIAKEVIEKNEESFTIKNLDILKRAEEIANYRIKDSARKKIARQARKPLLKETKVTKQNVGEKKQNYSCLVSAIQKTRLVVEKSITGGSSGSHDTHSNSSSSAGSSFCEYEQEYLTPIFPFSIEAQEDHFVASFFSDSIPNSFHEVSTSPTPFNIPNESNLVLPEKRIEPVPSVPSNFPDLWPSMSLDISEQTLDSFPSESPESYEPLLDQTPRFSSVDSLFFEYEQEYFNPSLLSTEAQEDHFVAPFFSDSIPNSFDEASTSPTASNIPNESNLVLPEKRIEPLLALASNSPDLLPDKNLDVSAKSKRTPEITESNTENQPNPISLKPLVSKASRKVNTIDKRFSYKLEIVESLIEKLESGSELLPEEATALRYIKTFKKVNIYSYRIVCPFLTKNHRLEPEKSSYQHRFEAQAYKERVARCKKYFKEIGILPSDL